MGMMKQLHIDCTPDKCLAPDVLKGTCYADELVGDIDPTEPSKKLEGGDRDEQIDIDKE